MIHHGRKQKKRAYFKNIILGVSSILCTGIILFSFWVLTLDIPDVTLFDQRKIIESTKIYDRTGTVLLYDVHGDIQRTVVPYKDIPIYVKNATVAIEDSNFYNHKGISIEGITRAFFTNLLSGNLKQGGSTITQQLARNSLLTNKKTITRKLKEIILALKLERAITKEDILYLYLNEIPYGGQNYGIGAASQSYFGKEVKELTLAESAYLAAMIQAPTYYSPYGPHRDKLEDRKQVVLARMKKLGFITKEEEEKANDEKVVFVPRGNESIKAPHFVMYVIDQLQEKYGKDVIDKVGLKVTTSLDWGLQQKAEELTKKYVEEEQDQFNVYNAGMVAIDPKTGHILVMVGSRDWYSSPLPQGCSPGVNCKFEPQVNVTTYAKGRQPGSSFKPFVYAAAFKKGYTPETVVFDLKTQFSTSCAPDDFSKESPCFSPDNYDNTFRGPVTLRDALAQSINIPSVKVLYLAGLKESLEMAKNLGITTINDTNRYGLTLVLGGGEVHLLEMTAAYSVFANEGVQNKPISILKVEKNNGEVLEEHTPAPFLVLEQQIARQINDVLSDNEARAPAFGEQSFLYFQNRDVAVKTGTTNDYRDAWVIGYTPNFSLGVWFGNNDNTPMEKKVAGFIAAPLWNAFLKEVFKTLPTENFIEPAPVVAVKPVLKGEWRGSRSYTIDTISKKLATEYTPKEYLKEKVITEIHSILYWLDKNNPHGEIPQHPENDPQFALWELPVRNWAISKGIKDESVDIIPKEKDDIHTEENKPRVYFITPPPSVISIKEDFSFTIKIDSRFDIKKIDTFIGGVFLGSSFSKNNQREYTILYNLEKIELYPQKTEVRVLLYDEVGNMNTITYPVKICLDEGC